jgi:predicted fused transcriptional regulator/phosphomethylpyrimidine kinase
MAEEAFFVKAGDTIILKIAIAKSLYLKKYDQARISKILNISQPMVSSYLNSNKKIPNIIIDYAENISIKIINGQNTLFHTCITFSEKSSEGKLFIAHKNEIISQENNKIIDNLTEAFLLLKDKDISKMIPKVKINIAMAKEKAKKSSDVASFLNGLIIVDEKPASINGIRFGKSKHLSNLLIYIKSKIDVNAIMNVAYFNENYKSEFTFGFLTRDYKLKTNNKNVDILLHKGDFGIEPCAYILGKNAVDVANKILKIKEVI